MADEGGFFVWTTAGLVLSLFVCYFACGHYTGGHLNPMISLACALGGICEMWRGLLYIPFQFAGFISGAYAWKMMYG